jgi:WD40 repeat protein
VSAAIAMVVIGLTIVTLSSRRNRNALFLAGEAHRTFTEGDQSGTNLVKAVLLSVASVRAARTADGHIALSESLGLLSRPPRWRHSLAALPRQGATVSRVRALAFSADGTRIAAADPRGPVQVFDAGSGQTVRSIDVQRRPAQFTTLVFSPDGARLIIGCAHQACVVDVASGKELTRLSSADERQSGTVWFAEFSADGRLLATSSYGSNVVSIYDTSNWTLSGSLVNHQGASGVFSLAFSRSGQWLATGTPSGVQLWRVGHYDAPAANVPAAGVVWSIAFWPDDENLVAGGNTVQAWRIESPDGRGTVLQRKTLADRKAQAVLPVVWHGSHCLATATGTIDVMCGQNLDQVMRLPIESVRTVVSADGLSLAAEQPDGTLALWPLDAGIEVARVSVGAPVLAIAMAEQSGWFVAGVDKPAAGNQGGEVIVLDLTTWRERTRLPCPPSIAALSASSSGRWLAVAGGDGLRVFDASTWREVKAVTYDSPVTRAHFSAEDRSLIAVTGDTVVALSPQDWSERLRVAPDNEADLRAVRLNRDGRLLAMTWHWNAGHDTGVELTRVFELQTGHEIGWEYGAPGGSNISRQEMERRVAEGKRAPTGGDVKTVKESQSWLPPEPDRSGDGAWSIKVAKSSLTLKDEAAGRTIGSFPQYGDIVGAYFLPSAAPRWVVTGGRDGTLSVWPLRVDELADQACARLAASLDPETLGRAASDAGAGKPCPAR